MGDRHGELRGILAPWTAGPTLSVALIAAVVPVRAEDVAHAAPNDVMAATYKGMG
jgi:hypothetical protein